MNTINTIATAIALTFGIAAGANAHPGEGMQHGQGAKAQQHQGMQGGMGQGMAQGMGQGMGHGMHANAGHGPMQGMGPGAGTATPNPQGPRGPNTGSTLKTPEEQAAMREKMQNAKTPEERRAIAMANRTEMEKRAAEQGTAHTHRGPRFGATTN